MKQMKLGLAIASGMLAGALAWAAGSTLSPDSYAKVEAQSLVTSPQSSWARAILFSDVLESPPSGRPQRLNRKNYLPMKLKTAGTAWVSDDLALKFQTLSVGETYSFAGTVDQISRRYYIIVDACYRIQTAEDMNEKWTDMLNPPAEGTAAPPADISDTAMQALLKEAQNSLIQLAKESNLTVAQLIEAQTDGGQRIAEHIVADALQGELKAQNKTAEELMIGSVLALLQKQAVLDESQKAAAEIPSVPEPVVPETTEPVPVEVAAVVEEGEAAPVELPEPEAKAEESVPMSDEVPADEGLAAAVEEMMAEVPETPVAVEEPVAVQLAEEPAVAAAADEEKPKKKAKTKKKKKATVEDIATEPAATETTEMPVPPVEEFPASPETAELVVPAEAAEGDEPVAAPPSSMLVVPMAEMQSEMVPMVSVEPTKAELARMKKQEAIEKRNRERAEKKAAAEAAAQKKLAEKQARAEAKRLASEARKAETEARRAELAQQQSDEEKTREEAAAKKAAELKAQQEIAKAEAEARKAMEEESKQLAFEEKQALETIRQAEELQEQVAAEAILREQTEKRLAEMAARKEVAEAAMRAMEEQKQADLQKLQEEAEAQAGAGIAEAKARIATEQEQQAEAIRIAQEVARHEEKAVQDASVRLEEEAAARRAAEEKLAQLEQEIRALESQAKQTKTDLGVEAEMPMVSEEDASADEPDSEESSALEARKRNAAEKKAEWVAEKKEKPAEKAAAKKEKPKAMSAEDLQKALDAGDLPEWMQPVVF